MFDENLIDEIIKIAHENDVEPAALMAVVEVESNGKLGARVNGKFEPLIRFEGHYFYRLLSNAKRNLAIVRGLASSKAGRVKNPFRQIARWKLLARAQQIDHTAALSSCSWGCGQVMGSHWRWLGYASIDALVSEARNGVVGQIKLMMRYIKKARLIEKLKNHDWAGFARAYNGPAYKRYKYHTKMRSAYLRFNVKMGGASRQSRYSERHQVQMLRFGSYGQSVKALQLNLRKLGFHLAIDGDFGPATERALKAFQKENKLISDGVFGPKSLEMMYRRLPRSENA